MPSRKSNVSAISNAAEEVVETTPARAVKDKDVLGGVDELSLPKSMVARLAKGVLPPNTQIHKDALLALHKSAAVFVSYIASNSNDNAQAAGKKTISPQDVLAALKDAEFEGFLPRLEAELKKYNDVQSDKRNLYRKRVKGEKPAAGANEDSELQTDVDASVLDEKSNGNGIETDGTRPAKKLRKANGDASVPEENDTEDEEDDEAHDAQENVEDEDDDDDEVADDAEDAEEQDEQDEKMEDSQDEDEDEDDGRPRNELHDEALDEPDSD